MSEWTGVRVSLGVSGSGKTYGIRQQVYEAARSGVPIVVDDRMHEWNTAPAYTRPCGVRSVSEAIEHFRRGKRLAVVRANVGPVDKVCIDACEWVLRRNRDRSNQLEIGIVIPEAHEVVPSEKHTLPDPIRRVLTQWRHWRVGTWWDSQRAALMSLLPIMQSTELRLYAMSGDADLARAKAIGGGMLVEQIRAAAVRYQAGQPGWHVRLGISKLPPYYLERLSAV